MVLSAPVSVAVADGTKLTDRGFNDNALPLENEVILAADAVCGFSKKPVDPWSGDHIGFVSFLLDERPSMALQISASTMLEIGAQTCTNSCSTTPSVV
jgi:hypothetical protein